MEENAVQTPAEVFVARLTTIPAEVSDAVDSWLQNPSMVKWDYQM